MSSKQRTVRNGPGWNAVALLSLTFLSCDAVTEMLQAKLAAYEEQQRTLQADLEQFTKRAASQVGTRSSASGKSSQVCCNSGFAPLAGQRVGQRRRHSESGAGVARDGGGGGQRQGAGQGGEGCPGPAHQPHGGGERG